MDFLTYLKDLDTRLLLAIQSIHSFWLDEFMHYISGRAIWIPLYAVLIYFLWKKYKTQVWKSILILVAGIIFSDQIASAVFKPVAQRLRPCHEAALEGKVRIVHQHCGGMYGFFSSHASTTFTIAIFFTFLFHKSRQPFFLLIIWAFTISISRVYLGVHYPGDILAGILCGSIIGWICFRITEKIHTKPKLGN